LRASAKACSLCTVRIEQPAARLWPGARSRLFVGLLAGLLLMRVRTHPRDSTEGRLAVNF
jgi:hypothetical protein